MWMGKNRGWMCPIYFRDLRDSEQQSFLRNWKKDKQDELLKAVDDGKDIIVGWYCEPELSA